MNERTTLWEWAYTTLIVGHEGPVLAFMLLFTAVIVIALIKGWVKIGPPAHKETKSLNGKEKMSEETRRHLYREDGTTKFMLRADCIRQQDDCGQEFCSKIDEVKTLVVAANLKVDVATKERTKEIEKISEFMGKTNEHMAHVNRDIKDIRGALLELAKGLRNGS